jgi:hypothetical protein
MRDAFGHGCNRKRNSSVRDATRFVEHDQVFEAFAPNRSDQALDVAILPRRARRGRMIANPDCSNAMGVGWKTFLRNHAAGIASLDLFVVRTIAFKLRYGHAAALALVGWYLIVPPDSTVPHSVDSAGPISRWSIVTDFESAANCKQALAELQSKNGDPAKLDRTGRLWRFQKRQPADPELAGAPVEHAACVATGNPQLKEK